MRGPFLPLLVALVLVPGCFVREVAQEPAALWKAADDAAPAGPAEPTPASPTPPSPTPSEARQNESVSAQPDSPTPAAAQEPDPAADAAASDNATTASPAPGADDARATNATQAANATGAANATQATNGTHANHTSNATRAGNASGVVLHRSAFDFSGGNVLVPRASTQSFDVPEGYARIVVNLTFVPKGSGSLMDRGASVSLLPPGGLFPAGTAQARPDTNATMEADADPGRWTLQFDGTAPVEARIVVTAFVT